VTSTLTTRDGTRIAFKGTPPAVFDELRARVRRDRSQFLRELAQPFYGANRPGAAVSLLAAKIVKSAVLSRELLDFARS
jgi:hypothetical protein